MALRILKENNAGEIRLNFDKDFRSLLKVFFTEKTDKPTWHYVGRRMLCYIGFVNRIEPIHFS